jgi:hypothetical protein
MGFSLLSNNCTLLETARIKTNVGSSALMSYVTNPDPSMNMFLQGSVVEAEARQQRTAMLLNRAALATGVGGQSFRDTGSDSVGLLSAPQQPYAPFATVLPYVPSAGTAMPKSTPGNAIAASPSTQLTPPQTTTQNNNSTPQDDQNGPNKSGFRYYGNRRTESSYRTSNARDDRRYDRRDDRREDRRYDRGDDQRDDRRYDRRDDRKEDRRYDRRDDRRRK